MTYREKFIEVFGYEPDMNTCPFDRCFEECFGWDENGCTTLFWNAEYPEKPEESFDALLKQYLAENDLRVIPNSEWEDLNSKWKECLGDIRDIKTRINALEPSSPKLKPEPIKGYICDPKKNKECKKTACYEKGGLCCLTLNPEYAKEPSEEKETELDEYSHPGIISHRHKEIETCVRVPKEEHTEMHRRKNL